MPDRVGGDGDEQQHGTRVLNCKNSTERFNPSNTINKGKVSSFKSQAAQNQSSIENEGSEPISTINSIIITDNKSNISLLKHQQKRQQDKLTTNGFHNNNNNDDDYLLQLHENNIRNLKEKEAKDLKNQGKKLDLENGNHQNHNTYNNHNNRPLNNSKSSSLVENGHRLSPRYYHDFGDLDDMDRPKKIYKVVLTGGPCGGKTTGQARLCTFFENLGWKVFRVPETANILLSGGIKFSELSEDQAIRFQEELLRTMMQIEDVFFNLAETVDRDVLVICDRGAMDASAFIQREKWVGILKRTRLNEIELRDSRYNQIIHMVSAANGAEPFYTVEDHACRSEGLDLARQLDQKAAQAWVGHPYFDVVDNTTDFENKLCRMIECVCQKLGIDVRDRLQTNSKKVKFLVRGPLPDINTFPQGFQDFSVVHDYMQTSTPKMQARLRKRGQKGNWSYTYTVRRPELYGQVVEVKTALTQRDYLNMLAQRDHNHVTVFKTRRCFLLNDQYFQLDLYKDPCHPRCKGLILLETYTTVGGDELQKKLPSFLTIAKEVTGDPRYSMFNLSLKDRWAKNRYFCQSLAGSDIEDFDYESMDEATEARLAMGC